MRLDTSYPATMAASEASATRDHPVNDGVPGRMISSTPANPTDVASHRRQPTGSPRNKAAPAVIASGRNCRIAVASAIGMLNSAVR